MMNVEKTTAKCADPTDVAESAAEVAVVDYFALAEFVPERAGELLPVNQQ